LYIGCKIEEETIKFYIRSIVFYGAETWTLRAVDRKRMESFEMVLENDVEN
jgi:hypothetical protein